MHNYALPILVAVLQHFGHFLCAAGLQHNRGVPLELTGPVCVELLQPVLVIDNRLVTNEGSEVLCRVW